ncbi:zinc ABC transporter substrate-binding protein [Ornithinimicrobium ciconiae]|uniref:Zinc ABC transporter substrate-binding protein n=1 Tax=Ornithinimicrobium ciconiae TaxID=2594265 RepID=A0A516GBW6_9MICO|nr:metal ABC transporter substrate-binding protein [Ornithinimicrobium ciconiae]QDO89025.1 zinc ABC transporter substrate-binding protein [Ornithinimicrobium ciconiae]
MTRRPLAFTAPLIAATALASCGSSDSGGPSGEEVRLHVVTAFYPLQFATQRVVGGAEGVSIETLASPGADAHDLELTPRQLASVSEADLVVYSARMQPAVDEAVAAQAADRSLDAATVADLVEHGDDDPADGPDGHDHESHEGHDHHEDADGEPHEGHDHGDEHADSHDHEDADSHEDEGADGHEGHDHGPLDPHFWLDPQRYSTVSEAIAEDLAALDPDNAETYRANAADFSAELQDLDQEFMTALADCEHDTLVTTHEAFGYLAERYGLHQVGITGIYSGAEASPARMAEITREVAALNVPAIYAESSLGGDLAEVIAAETGTEVLVLDPIEGITADSPGADYLEVMRANLTSLRQGQGCA